MNSTKEFLIDKTAQPDAEVIDPAEFDAAEELAMTEAGFGAYLHTFQTPFPGCRSPCPNFACGLTRTTH